MLFRFWHSALNFFGFLNWLATQLYHCCPDVWHLISDTCFSFFLWLIACLSLNSSVAWSLVFWMMHWLLWGHLQPCKLAGGWCSLLSLGSLLARTGHKKAFTSSIFSLNTDFLHQHQTIPRISIWILPCSSFYRCNLRLRECVCLSSCLLSKL